MESKGATPRVFISYSHADEEWKNRVVKHLGVLEFEELLSVWEDSEIAGGDNWLSKIKGAIQSCDVALLLISVDFLNSPFIRGTEVPDLLKRREQEGLRVIPVILKPCVWDEIVWLKLIQARPKGGNPLSTMTEPEADAALTALAKEIAKLARPATSVATSPNGPPIIPQTVKSSSASHDHRFGHEKRTAPMPSLDKYDIQKIEDLLTPLMESERERRALLMSALGIDTPLLQRLDLTGPVGPFLGDMIKALVYYGEVTPGKQALWALLETIRGRVGVDRQAKIDALRPVISALGRNDDQGRPAQVFRLSGSTREPEIPANTKEKSLENSFQNIAYSLKNRSVVFFLGPGINFDPDNSNEKSSLPPNDIDIASSLAEESGFINPPDLIGLPCEACPEKLNERPDKEKSPDVICPIIERIENSNTSEQCQDQLRHDQELLFARFELRCRSQYKIKIMDHGDDEPLFTKLSSELRKNYTFNRVQGFLAQQASKIAKMRNEDPNLSQLMIITTNYDSGLEKAFEKEGLPIDVVYYSTGAKRASEFYHKLYETNEKEYPYSKEDRGEKAGPNYEKLKVYDISTKIERPIIVKLHGGIVYRVSQDYDTFMIAETHQIDFFQKAKSEFPKALKLYLDKCDIVFLGYTANDADLQAILHYFFEKKDFLEKKDDDSYSFSFGWRIKPNREDPTMPQGWLVTQSPLKAAGMMNNEYYWNHWRVDIIECNCNKFVDLLQNYLENHLN